MRSTVCLVGQKFGRWTVVSKVAGAGQSRWYVVCDCGAKGEAYANNLKRGETKSCGCLKSEEVAARNTKHSNAVRGSTTKTYRAWQNMLERCNNEEHKNYSRYGGRGIKVCERWGKFENFLEDMGEAPEELTIDRVDNDKGYSKANCRWATRAQQLQNRELTTLTMDKVRAIRADTRAQSAIAKDYGVTQQSVSKIQHNQQWKEEY